MYLRTLTDDELITYAEQTTNALTTSDLERELLARFREQNNDDRLTVLDDAGIDTADDLKVYIAQVGKAREALEGVA